MIKVSVWKNEDGICNKVVLMDHADYAEYGKDIVCAAVSVLYINTVNAIEQFTEDDFVTEFDPKQEAHTLQMTSSISDESKLLLNTFLLGIQGVQEEYGKKYIKIVYK